MTEFFEGSDINDSIERMLAYIRIKTGDPKFLESGFSLDKIMHLYINFHKLALTRGGSYNELPKWLKSKKVVINPQNKDAECFKWAVTVALYHKEIKKDHQGISRLRPYEKQYNWEGFEFSVSIKKIDKFEKKNPGIIVNVLFSNKKSQNIYALRRSERNVKCKKQVNLIMIVIMNVSRYLSKLNGKTQHPYHYCMNCLNCFQKASARDRHYEYCSSNGHVKVNMPTEKEKWLKFHDGQYQFMLPFMLYADLESILKPVDGRNRDKMNTMKAERKGKAPYKETNVPSGWCVQSTFAYGDVPDPLKYIKARTVWKSL